jgi:hypothetical protein
MTRSESEHTRPTLVTIRTFASELEAMVAKSVLDAAGIACMISADDCGGLRPQLSMTQGIKLIVKSADVKRVEQFLTAPPIKDIDQ